MYDLVIRNGTIVDGSGAPAFNGDIAIKDGKIVSVGGKAGAGRREIGAADAEPRLPPEHQWHCRSITALPHPAADAD